MPWEKLTVCEQRLKFIYLYLENEISLSRLCIEFGISRTTGYKLINRYCDFGVDGLKDVSRAPHSHPNEVSEKVKDEIIQFRTNHPYWGAKKLKVNYERTNAGVRWPAASSIGNILRSNGLVSKRKFRNKANVTSTLTDSSGANDVWAADFKGQVMLNDNTLCYPFTLSDHASRMILCCRGQKSTSINSVKPIMVATFMENGLPKFIRTDNGLPFASSGYCGLSRLSAWWIRLGITPERITPGKPQQNGRHERMHRVLKEEAMAVKYDNLKEHQKAFDRFVYEYNNERPHEALGMKVPSDLYERSPREYPLIEPKVEYGESMITRYVKTNGTMNWKGNLIFVSEVIASDHVALEQVDEKHLIVYYGHVAIGVLDESKKHMLNVKDAKVLIEQFKY